MNTTEHTMDPIVSSNYIIHTLWHNIHCIYLSSKHRPKHEKAVWSEKGSCCFSICIQKSMPVLSGNWAFCITRLNAGSLGLSLLKSQKNLVPVWDNDAIFLYRLSTLYWTHLVRRRIGDTLVEIKRSKAFYDPLYL